MVTKKEKAQRAESFDGSTMNKNTGKVVPSKFRLGTARLTRRSNSIGVMSSSEGARSGRRARHRLDVDDPSNGSMSSSEGAIFQRARHRLRGRSQSLPLEDAESERLDVKRDAESLTLGRQRLQRRVSLDFLRRSSLPKRHRSSYKDISSGSSSTDESNDCPLQSSDEECQSTAIHKDLREDGKDCDKKLSLSTSPNSLFDRTQVVPQSTPVSSQSTPVGFGRERISTKKSPHSSELRRFSCSTTILQHSYLEMVCGKFDILDDYDIPLFMPDDPTVQESIECIFSSQLEEGLRLWDEEEDFESPKKPGEIISPALLQQSRLNRSDRSSSSLSQSKERYRQASLLYVGTFDPSVENNGSPVKHQDPLPCLCEQSFLPSLTPEHWPQAPILLRPTPGSGTRVKGIRFGNSKDWLWEPGSHLSWSECLARSWGVPVQRSPRTACCQKCTILPINNGNEPQGETLVTDFETDTFEGSFLLRLRFSEGSTRTPYDDKKGYFAGMNRRYQAVVRGRFKKAIPLTELVTGFQLRRPCGKLPPKWILRGGLKVLSFFAPQLQANLEGVNPYSLTPLGSTPQSIAVDLKENDNLEDKREEPPEAERTLLGESSVLASSLQRAKVRKKAFDRLYVQKSLEPRADPTKIYTFEFLQHLFNFQDFSIELGSMLGSVNLEEILDGQPLQIMARHGDQNLWSFDVWHECLVERAKFHDR